MKKQHTMQSKVGYTESFENYLSADGSEYLHFTPTFTSAVWKAVKDWDNIDPYGACRIVVKDENLDNDSINFCLRQKDCTHEERVFLLSLLEMSEDERETACAIHWWESGTTRSAQQSTFLRLKFGDEFMDALSYSQRLTDLFQQALDDVRRNEFVVHDPSCLHQSDPLERFVEEVRARFQEFVEEEMGL